MDESTVANAAARFEQRCRRDGPRHAQGPGAAKAEEFLRSIPDCPFHLGWRFNLANVSYRTFLEQDVLQQLQRLEGLGQQ